MSHTNTETINSTEINNSGPFRVGDDLTSGTAGQVLKSQGDNLAPEWGTDTDTTYQGSSTINIDTTTDGKLTGIEILKASKKINIDTILSYTLELDQGILRKKTA